MKMALPSSQGIRCETTDVKMPGKIIAYPTSESDHCSLLLNVSKEWSEVVQPLPNNVFPFSYFAGSYFPTKILSISSP